MQELLKENRKEVLIEWIRYSDKWEDKKSRDEYLVRLVGEIIALHQISDEEINNISSGYDMLDVSYDCLIKLLKDKGVYKGKGPSSEDVDDPYGPRSEAF